MNQIFRVIWSQATQTWVAVSELTKAHKKQSTTSTAAQESAVKILGNFFKLSTLTLAVFGSMQAQAAKVVGAVNEQGTPIVTGEVTVADGIAIGTNNAGGKASVKGAASVAIGVFAQSDSKQSISLGRRTVTSLDNSIAIGNEATAKLSTGNTVGTDGIAIGNKATIYSVAPFDPSTKKGSRRVQLIQYGRSKIAEGIAIGTQAGAATGSIDIGNRDYTGLLGDVNLTNVNTFQKNSNVGATTLGDNSLNSSNFASIVGSWNSISAVRQTSGLSGITNRTRAGSNSQGMGSTILGQLNSMENLPIESNKALIYSGLSNSIVGTANRIVHSNGALIWGTGNQINRSLLQMDDYLDVTTPASAKAFQERMIKYSTRNRASSVGVMGSDNEVDQTAMSTVFGVGNRVKTNETISETDMAKREYSSDTAEAAGDSLSALNMNSFLDVSGYENNLKDVTRGMISGVKNTLEYVTDVVMFGTYQKLNGTKAKQAERNVILGFNYDNANPTEHATKPTKGQKDIAESVSDTIGIGSDIKLGADRAIAIGLESNAHGEDSIAMGTGNLANGTQSIAIGYKNQVYGKNSGAFGDPNYIGTADKTVNGVVTKGTEVTGTYVFGNNNGLKSDGTISPIITNDTFVLGSNVVTTAKNSVALGKDTAITAGEGKGDGTLKAKKTQGEDGDKATTAGATGEVTKATVNGITYEGFQGSKSDGAVSVGSSGKERRIQNVAAGEISATSTDAINGSQLYLVADGLATKINAINTSVNTANAGWKLQNNGGDKKTVKPNDTVNFVNGGNTVADVTTDGNVTFNVVGLPIAYTVTNTNGQQVQLAKVGDVYYPINADGTPNTSDKATPYRVINGNIYAPDQLDEVKNDAGVVIDYKPKLDAKPTALNTNLVNPNQPTENNGQVNTPTQLGNVANGANTSDAPKVDASGNNQTKIGGNYYPEGSVEINGKVYPAGTTAENVANATAVTPLTPTAVDSLSDIKMAKDGNWYKAADVNPDGSVKVTKNTPATPVSAPTNPGNAGLINFANSNLNNAASVGDLQNLGWVVSTSDKDGKETYNDQVRNSNKVDFTGKGLATVTGKTLADGTRQITVSVRTGEVTPTNRDQNTGTTTITNAEGNQETVNVVKANDGNWYRADQVTTTTDPNTGNTVINPNDGATAIAQNNVTVPNSGSGLVTGNQVGDAIQQSGWNVGLADKTKADAAFADSNKALSAVKLEKVNPDDNVRFADGKGTKVSAATVDEVNRDGKKITNTYVKVDIDTGELSANPNGSVSGPVTQTLKDAATAAKTTADAAQTALNEAQIAYDNASPEQKDALKVNLDNAQTALNNANTALTNANNAVTNAGNQVATAQNVADAINNSGFNLKTSGNKVKGTQDNGELIKPSNTVEMIAGKNLTVKQDTNGKVTYETANDVQFNSVQFGDNNGPKITNNNGNINVSGADGTSPTKITGVANGDISPTSTDAVNGSQLYSLIGDQTNVNPRNNSYDNITYDNNGNPIFNKVVLPDGQTVLTDKVTVIENGKVVEKEVPMLKTYNVHGQKEIITNNLPEAIYNMNEQGIKFFHSNDGIERPKEDRDNNYDSSASGKFATAIGHTANAEGENGIAMGNGAQALAKNTIAIGTGNIVSATKSGAFGNPNYIDGKEVDGVATVSGSYAFGNDNVINSSNTFVLGNNVNNKGTTTNGRPDAMGTTVENSVYLGNQTTATAGDGSRTGTLRNLDVNGNQGATTTAGSTGTVSQAVVGNLTYGGFAGAKANGVVSVGAAGSERRIQNVAAGEISATSTDAINGSQLYSVARGVSNLAGQVNKMGKRMDANAAAAMAAANLLQAYREGQSAVTAGVGQHRGQAAVAVGYSRLSDSGKIGIKFSLSADTQGEVSTGAGIGYFW